MTEQMTELAAVLKAHNDKAAAALAELQEQVARAVALREAAEALVAEAKALVPAAATDEGTARRVDTLTAAAPPEQGTHTWGVEPPAMGTDGPRLSGEAARAVATALDGYLAAELADTPRAEAAPAKKPRQRKARASKNGT
jgi:hypothetical protein